eukprot:gene6165-biopygen11846
MLSLCRSPLESWTNLWIHQSPPRVRPAHRVGVDELREVRVARRDAPWIPPKVQTPPSAPRAQRGLSGGFVNMPLAERVMGEFVYAPPLFGTNAWVSMVA